MNKHQPRLAKIVYNFGFDFELEMSLNLVGRIWNWDEFVKEKLYVT